MSESDCLNANNYATLADTIGNTPLVRLKRIAYHPQHIILGKLEGNNPAGSVKDRPAQNMIRCALERKQIAPGDQLIEATSGNTGIALAMAAAAYGLKLTLIMPETSSEERKLAMAAYGAKLVEVSGEAGMEGARDLAMELQAQGKGIVLDQFANPDNPASHYNSTGPEIWHGTNGCITHFVSSMGTTGTIMGTSRYLKEQNSAVQIIGLQPAAGAKIPGIRRWSEQYLPSIYDPAQVDQVLEIDQSAAEIMMRTLAEKEGIFAGVSSGGAVAGALQLSQQLALAEPAQAAIIVCIICDRGDRYLSTGVFNQAQEL